MSLVGKSIRLGRIFDEYGKTFVIARGFRYRDPPAMVKAISRTLHENESVENALKNI